jgi:purine-cytosine permease-like protein
LVPVPETALRTTTAIFFVFTGVLACIAALWGGAALGTQYTLADMVWVAIIGCLIQGVIGFLTAYMGALSSYQRTRAWLGHMAGSGHFYGV